MRLFKGLDHIVIITIGSAYIKDRDLRLMILDGVFKLPVGNSQRISVPAEIIGGQTVLLPEIHGIDPVNNMAGAEKQSIVVRILLKEGRVFIIVISPVGDAGKVEDAGYNND